MKIVSMTLWLGDSRMVKSLFIFLKVEISYLLLVLRVGHVLTNLNMIGRVSDLSSNVFHLSYLMYQTVFAHKMIHCKKEVRHKIYNNESTKRNYYSGKIHTC